MERIDMPDVMISYAHSDARNFAGRLHQALNFRGVETWLDTAEVLGGSQWLRAISQAVQDCKVFIAIEGGSVDYCE